MNKYSNDAVDAARYRWLRNKSQSIEMFGSFSPYVIQGQTGELLDGDDLDDEVDAAIAASEAKDL